MSTPPTPADLEAHAWFQEAYRLERIGAFEAAFAAFTKANAIKRASLFPEGLARLADQKAARNLELYGEAFLRASEHRGHPSAAPVFVVGMPRSGSTLIEQILISHREVRGVGECNVLRSLIESGPPDNMQRTGAQYLAALRGLGWVTSRRVVDKSLMNHMVVGLIHALFPKATIIHAVRDPMDTCLSIWRRNFAEANDTAYDFADIAADFARYRRVMATWERLLPGRMIRVEYERLVAEPETEMRRLVDGVGLAWDPACLRFHEAPRKAVGGAADQVRSPLNRDGIGRWRRYEPFLPPSLDGLRLTAG